MAITKGVEEPDLDFIKKNSEKIVEKAFEKEKINWKGFISDLRKPLMKLSLVHNLRMNVKYEKKYSFLSLILLLSIASGSCKRISNKNETKK